VSIKNLRRIILLLVLISINNALFAQSELLPLGGDLNFKLGSKIYFNKLKRVHTSVLPYIASDLDSSGRDSLLTHRSYYNQSWQSKNWLFRKIFQQHLVEVTAPDFSFYLDFLPDMLIGKEGDHGLWLNTRGIELGGKVGKQFAFTSHLFEDQGRLPDYETRFANTNLVVPGQGAARPFGKGAFDFGYSGGTLSFTPNKYLNLQLGYDKNFIGDGYRSLLLSDNSFNYPFFKVTGTLGNVRYMAMFAQFLDFNGLTLDDETPFPKKYGMFHYLTWNASERFSLGLFENVMWKPRGFEFSYFNPGVILRPIEYANGSPDKALVGLNGSYKIADRYVAYGQLMINEFAFKEITSNKGSVKNKNGVQLGIKGFSVFNVKNLNAQFEMNRVRPYAYAATEHYKNYGHYNQSLAHPFGANFREYLGILNYSYKRFDLRLQHTAATYGLDINNLNYGKDIYKSYLTAVSEYGVQTGQGLKTTLAYSDAKLAYLLNSKNNLRLELGYTIRKERNVEFNDREQFITIGLRSSFRNLYNDF
jgi:hypothetical protein